MAEFVCRVADSTGRVFSQVEPAQSVNEARQKLAERGLYVYSVKRRSGLFTGFQRREASPRARGADFLIFYPQFNTPIKACLPAPRAPWVPPAWAGSPPPRPPP